MINMIFLATWGNSTDNVSSPFKLIWRPCEQTAAHLHVQQLCSNIIIHLKSSLCPPGEYKSNIRSLFALFLVSTTSCNNLNLQWLIFFGHFGAAETKCEHNTIILSVFKLIRHAC